MKKMYILVICILFILCGSSSGEEIRGPAVSGAFYPKDRDELKSTIARFLNSADKVNVDGNIKGIMVPHAGYVYSGKVQAEAYKQLEGRDIKRAIIMCNSHTSYFEGIALDPNDKWLTPLGEVEVDKEFSSRLVASSDIIRFNESVHLKDHTIEVQLPFLQFLFGKDIKIVPILFGTSLDSSYKELSKILSESLEEGDLLIASTDMSHYPKYEDANEIDRSTLDFVKEKNILGLESHIENIKDSNIPGEDTLCCGMNGVKTLMEVSDTLAWEGKVLKYANSGDVVFGDKRKVVGYGSVLFYSSSDSKNVKGKDMKDESLNKEEKKKLMGIAWSSIIEAVGGEKSKDIEVNEDKLLEKRGAFVTIKKEGQLRGCIGYVVGVKPLHQTVRSVARSAALDDPRFRPVSKGELDELELEISALTPLKKIASIDEIEVGMHGLVIKKGFRQGLLLPQVATEYNWDKETFLGHTCQKAGLPTDAWKDPGTEILVFSAEVFDENDIK
ncbi:MAG: AmmeMemoRadiSam system protein B [Candidatus Omnitrophota bacterium]